MHIHTHVHARGTVCLLQNRRAQPRSRSKCALASPSLWGPRADAALAGREGGNGRGCWALPHYKVGSACVKKSIDNCKRVSTRRRGVLGCAVLYISLGVRATPPRLGPSGPRRERGGFGGGQVIFRDTASFSALATHQRFGAARGSRSARNAKSVCESKRTWGPW